MKKNIAMVFAALLLLGSCASSNQFNGTMTGSMLGGVFGSSIGGLFGGPRGHDSGTLVGMVIGGVVGAAATAPQTSGTKAGISRNDQYDETDVDSYNRHGSASSRRSETGVASNRVAAMEEEYKDLKVENLRFVDANNNRTIDAGERSRIEFELYNRGTETVYNIAPVVNVIDNKRIIISPTAIVASLAPGKGVRYAAELYAKENLRAGTADFSLGFAKGDMVYTVRTFQLSTFGR